MAGPVFANPVEHYDRVVHAEADDGHHRRYEQGVDLGPKQGAQDGEDADHDDDVMEQRDQRSRAELDALEPDADPDQDSK